MKCIVFAPTANAGANQTVKDDDNVEHNQNTTLTVNNVNRAPTINLPSSITVVNGFPETLNLDDYADDADNDNLTYTVLAKNDSEADCDITANTLTISQGYNYTGSAEKDPT